MNLTTSTHYSVLYIWIREAICLYVLFIFLTLSKFFFFPVVGGSCSVRYFSCHYADHFLFLFLFLFLSHVFVNMCFQYLFLILLLLLLLHASHQLFFICTTHSFDLSSWLSFIFSFTSFFFGLTFNIPFFSLNYHSYTS